MSDPEAPPTHESFAALLRRHRLGAGLTQEALAERAGLSDRAISALERGVNRQPHLETVHLLATALALDPAQRAIFLAAARPEIRPAPPAVVSATTPPHSPSQGARHNLPVALSSLVGREDEQRAVLELLETVRLVTLTGAGGVGKTRLGLAVARHAAEIYAEGAWLVELAGLREGALVVGAVARVLGVREEAGRDLVASLADHLREQHLLLVLDNCEHLLDPCAGLVDALLRACAGLRVLATSREGLGVEGERLYRVPSLSVPDPRRSLSFDALGRVEAVRLFVERARARAGFAFTVGNADLVATICRRLEGIPLAIELAAGRVGGLPLEVIAERLDHGMRLLAEGPRTAPTRQQTLRATLDWSWALLGDAERVLLRRLCVFAGGWTSAAAEAVCALTPDPSPMGKEVAGGEGLDLLSGLVNKSLALLEEQESGAGRYRLLEPVRQYAGEQLDASGEAAALRGRHLDWCVALAEEAEPHLVGPDLAIWLERLDAEHDNLRAALGWSLVGDHTAGRGVRLAGALWRFWHVRGHLGEGRRWLDEILPLGHAATTAHRARAFNGAGSLAFAQSDLETARRMFEECLALYRELGDRRGVAGSLGNLGSVAHQQGDVARARTVFEECLPLFRALGDRRGVAICLNNLGVVAQREGDFARARALDEECLALFRALGERRGIANALDNLGVVAGRQGDWARARALYAEELTLFASMGEQWGIAIALEGFARVAGALDQSRRAALLWGVAAALRQRLGTPRPSSEQTDYDQAVAALRAALGAADYEAAYAAGQSMPLEEATALALDVGDANQSGSDVAP